MNIAAEWAKYYTLSGCRQSLLDGGWAINAIDKGLDSMDVLLREAVKGNYYGDLIRRFLPDAGETAGI